MELYIVWVLEDSDRAASCHGQTHGVNDQVPHTADKPVTDVFPSVRHHGHFSPEEHVIAVEVKHVVCSRGTAVCRVSAVDDDLGILADPLEDDGVPVAFVDFDGVHSGQALTATAVKPKLDQAAVHLVWSEHFVSY